MSTSVAPLPLGRTGRGYAEVGLALGVVFIVALLMVPVAVVSSRLGPLWLVQLPYWLGFAGTRRPDTWQLLVALGTTAFLVGALTRGRPTEGGGATIRSDVVAAPLAT